ncbi:MAG: hypothetical protein ABIG93_00355 [archaeon]|nr:hypothetical protein [Nanoarchaeota archaeon]
MVYIRVKKINQKPYAYLVESKKSKNGPRQKVKKYLGRICEFDKKDIEEKIVSSKNKSNFLSTLILPELVALGFKEKSGNYFLKNLVFDSKKLTLSKQTKSKTVKDAIISLNDGYLCSFTLQRILRFKKGADLKQDAEILAKYFLEAGIKISRENFIGYYKLL